MIGKQSRREEGNPRASSNSRPTNTGQRGCGERQDHALYAAIEPSPYGREIEDFFIDPMLEWTHGTLRAPMLVPRGEGSGVVDACMTVGRSSYPYLADYCEELRHLGVSKRLPRDFEVEALTPGESILYLVHPRGIALGGDIDTGENLCRQHSPHDGFCVYNNWPLSTLESVPVLHEVVDDSGAMVITTPSVVYETVAPVYPEVGTRVQYMSGVFLGILLSHFEYCSHSGDVPEDLLRRFEDCGWRLEVVDK